MKETFYLMDEGHPLLRSQSNFHAHGLAGYRSYFESRAEHKIIFEATTHYIYQQTALDVLSQFPDRPQIVFVLRKPSERVYSSFQYSKHNLANVRADVTFARFIELLKCKNGDSLSSDYAGDSAYVLSRDLEYSRYIEHLQKWRERFGPERVHVLLFERLKSRPADFMKELALLLGIDETFYQDYDFQVRNETTKIKYPALHRRVRSLGRVIAPVKTTALKKAYLKAQAVPNGHGRSQEDIDLLAQLEQEFVPFNDRLAEEFGLDLSVWK